MVTRTKLIPYFLCNIVPTELSHVQSFRGRREEEEGGRREGEGGRREGRGRREDGGGRREEEGGRGRREEGGGRREEGGGRREEGGGGGQGKAPGLSHQCSTTELHVLRPPDNRLYMHVHVMHR